MRSGARVLLLALLAAACSTNRTLRPLDTGGGPHIAPPPAADAGHRDALPPAPDAPPAPDSDSADTPRPGPLCGPSSAAPDNAWYRSAVFYEVFVRSFRDADGDGIGDLRGLTAKLDYLNDGDPATDGDLGVTALWLMPIMAAPSYHGYDTMDYVDVAADYGTLADWDALAAAAHARGIRVVLDLVLNHSSSAHPWFEDSAGGAQAAHREWYVWRADDPGWTRPWGGSGSTWHARGGAYYYGLFSAGMPDLNYANAEVRAAAADSARFWLARGADGFRLDAVRYLVETGAGPGQQDTPETHAVWKWLRAELQRDYPQAALVGEAWTERANVVPYFGSGDELHMAFDFDMQAALVAAVTDGAPTAVADALCGTLRDLPAVAQDATFLANHDMLRIASQLGDDPARLRLAAALLLTLPGTPFLYYGEELGQPNGPGLGDEHKRLPMRWDATALAGFTDGASAWMNPVAGPDVAAQNADPGSLLSHYRVLIRLRQAHAALAGGRTELLPAAAVDSPTVLAFLRVAPDETLLVVHNFGTATTPPVMLRLAGRALAPSAGFAVVPLFGDATATAAPDATVVVSALAPGGSAVFQL